MHVRLEVDYHRRRIQSKKTFRPGDRVGGNTELRETVHVGLSQKLLDRSIGSKVKVIPLPK